jgi:hypothetical protein
MERACDVAGRSLLAVPPIPRLSVPRRFALGRPQPQWTNRWGLFEAEVNPSRSIVGLQAEPHGSQLVNDWT